MSQDDGWLKWTVRASLAGWMGTLGAALAAALLTLLHRTYDLMITMHVVIWFGP